MDSRNNRQDGHRERLRKRFIQGGFDGFLDYEIIELLLTLGTPRKDCKPMAKDAIEKFGSLQNILDASYKELQQIDGVGPSNAFGIKLFQAVSERYAKEKISNKTKFNSPKIVAEYLQKYIGREKKENFVLLCLDSRNNLIVDKVSIGTLNASLVHPREVFKSAIQANAAQVIIAHNHPSNDPEPSENDLVTTKRLVETGKILGIAVIDHIIITKNGFLSLKNEKLI